MESCTFCKIIKQEIPCEKIYEDADFLSFVDIEPVSDGHILVIPKEHIVWMQEAKDEVLSGIFKLSKKLMTALKKSFSCDYVQVAVSGQDIPHFHIHLIPRYYKDNLSNWPTKKYKKGEIEAVAKKITQEL